MSEKWTTYPRTIDKEYYEAIGEICQRWAWLEFQLGVIARETLKISKPAGFSVTGGMSMRSICGVLIALSLAGLPKNRPDIVDATNKLANKLIKIGDMRNEYAHGLWCYEKESNPALGIRKLSNAKDRPVFKWIKKPIKSLRNDARILHDLQIRAQEITDALKGRIPKLTG
jgi:hypothetical protein